MKRGRFVNSAVRFSQKGAEGQSVNLDISAQNAAGTATAQITVTIVAAQAVVPFIVAGLSAPFVLRILPLQFLFDFRIRLLPKVREVRGDLDGAVIWREDLDDDGDAASGDAQVALHPV